MGPNPIWEYFSKNEVNATATSATCKVCSKSLSLGSSLPKKQTISNIKNHLEKIHKNEWKAYCKANDKYQSLIKFKKSEINITNVKKGGKESSQSTLQEIIEKK